MIKDEEVDEFSIWLQSGINRGWISTVVCATHDGIDPISEEELQEWEAGNDPCQFVVRILE